VVDVESLTNIGVSHKSTSIWSGNVEKMERHLVGWKMLYLLKGGRLTLIKNTFFMGRYK
jgi:hypothetical protein